MENIYQFAAFNIAATAAKDGTGGLFYPREPREIESFKVDVAWFGTDATGNDLKFGSLPVKCTRGRDPPAVVESAPLNGRAWVMQERLLSRRIIHYTNDEVLWECQQSFVSESNPDQHSRGLGTRDFKLLLNENTRSDEQRQQSTSVCNNASKELLYQQWYSFRYSYSSCQLTYETDKFVAFAGIARRVAALLEDELVAGHWRSRLLSDLCWQKEPRSHSCRSEIWLAPSWSWASRTEVVYGEYDPPSLLDDEAQIVDVRVEKDSSNTLRDASLTLRCRPILVRWDVKKNTMSLNNSTRMHRLHGPPRPEGLSWDDTRTLTDRYEATFIILQHRLGKVRGLMLVPSSQRSAVFERVGGLRYDPQPRRPGDEDSAYIRELWEEIIATHEQTEEQTITIV